MNYNQIADMAKRMIAKFGRDVVIKRVTKEGYDPLTNSFQTSGTTEKTVKAAIVEYKISEIDGEVIKRGDKKVFFDATADIRKGDLLVDNGTYAILDIEEVNPGSKLLVFKAQARK